MEKEERVKTKEDSCIRKDPVMLDTLSEVQLIISNQLDVPLEQVKPESLIKDELGADSLEKVEIIIQFEEMFNIIIHDKDAEKIRTVAEAAKAVDELRIKVIA